MKFTRKVTQYLTDNPLVMVGGSEPGGTMIVVHWDHLVFEMKPQVALNLRDQLTQALDTSMAEEMPAK